MDKELTISDCFSILKTFQKNKTPGNDGLTVEFYLEFWPILAKPLVNCLNFAHYYGELSNSQKQALITLLEKKDKDRRFIKNWRPISLINVDVKIASKVIAKRLEPLLPDLIHNNQNAFIRGRSIFDAVRTIDDVLEYAKITNKSGILVTIDFEKAFDSLNHTYLFKVLQKYNFGPYVIQWIKTFYTNISSCVLNNGFTTVLFQVSRGVRQGDPLPPLLFILALKVLSCYIRQNNNIQGLNINGEEIKLTVFADDMACYLKNKQSYSQLFVTLKLFSEHSGLHVNNEKTEVFAIGLQQLSQKDFSHKIQKSIKILGVYFNYNKPARKKANFDMILKSIQKTLNMWKWRGLTLLGRIQIVKTFAIPKFMYKATLIPVSQDLISEINKLLYGFIWKGKDKVKRSALINDIDDGGLKMLDIQSMISAQRVTSLKKYMEDYNSTWKSILDFFLRQVGGKFLLHCNFETRNLPIYLPEFYKECLESWMELNPSTVKSYDEVANQIIWNNKNILVGKSSIFLQHLLNQGFVKIGNLLSNRGTFLENSRFQGTRLSPVDYFKLMGIFNAIPSDWRAILKQNHGQHPTPLNDFIELNIDGTYVNLLKLTSKMIYKRFKIKKQTPPSAQEKLTSKYPELSTDWKQIYTLAFNVAQDTKSREFQYNILNNIVFTNDKLFRFKMIDSPLCAFCREEVESLEHLFCLCKVTKTFWNTFFSWLNIHNFEEVPFTVVNILFGFFDISKDFHLLNHLVLLAKQFIYRCKLNSNQPSFKVFLAKIKTVYEMERLIAKDRNQLPKHFSKWKRILPLQTD